MVLSNISSHIKTIILEYSLFPLPLPIAPNHVHNGSINKPQFNHNQMQINPLASILFLNYEVAYLLKHPKNE